MIQKHTLDFLTQLKKNNSKEWFHDHQAEYKKAKADVEQMGSEIIDQLGAIDNDLRKRDVQVKKCFKRINRDIRFSADKSPYKTNFFAIFNPHGYKSEHASYYMHIEPNNSFVGGGVYMPPTPTLNMFRKEIAYELEEWESLIHSTAFKEAFPNGIESPSELKTAPKGFDIESPAIQYLRMKGFFTMRKLTDQEITSEKAISIIIESYKAVSPVVKFLNRALA